MKIHYYPMIVSEVGDEMHGSFPDLPGLTAFGADWADLMHNAEIGAALHLDGMHEDGDSIPAPSALTAEPVDPEAEPEIARVMVRAPLPGKTVRMNVTIDDGLLAAIDAAAARRDQSRAGFLAAAARAALIGGG
jgi:predicted RNase H-like HicB family nuclease